MSICIQIYNASTVCIYVELWEDGKEAGTLGPLMTSTNNDIMTVIIQSQTYAGQEKKSGYFYMFLCQWT